MGEKMFTPLQAVVISALITAAIWLILAWIFDARDPEMSREERNRHNIETCIARGGEVLLSDSDWYKGCVFEFVPTTTLGSAG